MLWEGETKGREELPHLGDWHTGDDQGEDAGEKEAKAKVADGEEDASEEE